MFEYTVDQMDEMNFQLVQVRDNNLTRVKMVFEQWVRHYGPDMARQMQHKVERTNEKQLLGVY